MELEQILRQHAGRYPKMQPTDGVKLIYQHTFGGGHLITNVEAFMGYLRREFAAVEKGGGARYEDIGNGLCRVHLGAVREEELERLGRAFISSAEEHRGTLEEFLTRLELLRRLTAEGVFGFGCAELEEYLREYAAAGYPMVSHSPEFREAYKPAYRVIKMDGRF